VHEGDRGLAGGYSCECLELLLRGQGLGARLRGWNKSLADFSYRSASLPRGSQFGPVEERFCILTRLPIPCNNSKGSDCMVSKERSG